MKCKRLGALLFAGLACWSELYAQEEPSAAVPPAEAEISPPVLETPVPEAHPVETPPAAEAVAVPEAPLAVPPPATPIPPAPAPPKAVLVPLDSMGRTEGEFWIGQRAVVDRYIGWGWIKEPKQGWRSGKWVMLLETPGGVVAPHRFLGSFSADTHVQYKLFGRFADFKGYEPNYDVFVDVFILEGFEKIGPGSPVKKEPPRNSSGGRGSNALPSR